MEQITEAIKDAITAAQAPAILCSWGKDSAVLLHYARQVKPDIGVYFFGDELPKPAWRAVVDEGLAVYSYAPADRYLALDGDELILIEEYSFNGVRVPMLSPVAVGDKCAHSFSTMRTPVFHFPNDVILWGYRKADTHSLIPRTFAREIQIGHTKFIAPLYECSDKQVVTELAELGLEHEVDDAVKICNECFEAALAGFRGRCQLDN